MSMAAARKKSTVAEEGERRAITRTRGRRGRRRKTEKPVRRRLTPEQLEQLRRDWDHCT